MGRPQINSRHDEPLAPILMTQVDASEATSDANWLWHGYIARGNVTLFTSQWKTGKTTLLTGLLQRMAGGGKFLDRSVAAAKVLYVSEEPKPTWAARLRRMPVGDHCRLLSRPFPRRPTTGQFERLVEFGMELQAAGNLDLLVIDPLAKFLPGAGDTDLNSLELMLDPLRCLTDSGVGVTILHHPRRRRSEEGNTARGHGGLLAAVDIIVELSGFGALDSEERRRKLFALSRFPETPRRLVYEWDPQTAQFQLLGDPHGARFRDNWEHLHAILKKRALASTHKELLMDWPVDLPRPSAATLYDWLNRAYEEKLLRRQGTGRAGDPYRYRLENEDDPYYDRGELPPLRDLNLLPR
jgi:AAA domain